MRLLIILTKFRVVLCFVASCVLLSCEQQVISDIDGTNQEEEDIYLEVLTENEQEFITHLLKAELDIDILWPSFNGLREISIYIITDENKGIYINPAAPQEPKNIAIKNDVQGFRNIELYRNDSLHQFASSELELITNWFWTFSEYDGEDLLIVDLNYEDTNSFYYQYKNRFGFYHVSVLYHELFHVYSLSQEGTNYLGEGNSIRNEGEYPLTSETMPYVLLLYHVMIDAHQENDKEHQRKLLEYYVSIYKKLLELDPTENNLVRSHGLYQEKIEGAARYVEIFGTLNSLDNNTIEDPTHGYKNIGDNARNRNDVVTVYGLRLFYHSGAGAIHLLNSLGYENLDKDFLIPTNTTYDLARDFINLNEEELEIILENAKIEYQWGDIEERAIYLNNL